MVLALIVLDLVLVLIVLHLAYFLLEHYCFLLLAFLLHLAHQRRRLKVEIPLLMAVSVHALALSSSGMRYCFLSIDRSQTTR